MERKYFKALNFDLVIHLLKEHYPGTNYRQEYDDLRRFFKQHQISTDRAPGTYLTQNWLRHGRCLQFDGRIRPSASLDWGMCQKN